MENTDEVPGLTGAYAEADQDVSTSLALASENVAGLRKAAEEHEAAMRKLEADSASGGLDTAELERELMRRTLIIKRLNRARMIFEGRISELEKRRVNSV